MALDLRFFRGAISTPPKSGERLVAALKTITRPGVDRLVCHWVDMHGASSQRGERTRHRSTSPALQSSADLTAGQTQKHSANRALAWGFEQNEIERRAAAELFRCFQSVIVSAKYLQCVTA